MLSSCFRPWGQLNWILNKLSLDKYFHLGCISTEDRCLKSFEILNNQNLIFKSLMVEIQDPPSEADRLINKKILLNKKLLFSYSNSVNTIKMDLLCDDFEIFDLSREIINIKYPNLIFDITSFPKRYFFPIIKSLTKDTSFENIIITYTQPIEYSRNDLSDDPEPWYPLPLFMSEEFPEPNYELAFVGTGFMPFSLPKLLKDNHSEISLRLFFPFPPGPPNYQRSWEFIRKIEKHYTLKDRDHIVRVDAHDINGTFDYIKSATDDGNKKCIFAPYGPKPISLAMCLYAIKYNAPVFYTQPKFYNPDYSTGSKETFAYPLRLFNKNYFN